MILVFRRSEYISRDNDVTIVLALNRIADLIDIFFRNACHYLYILWVLVFRSAKFHKNIKIYKRNFHLSWNFYKKA